jgi:hypothetical protein
MTMDYQNGTPGPHGTISTEFSEGLKRQIPVSQSRMPRNTTFRVTAPDSSTTYPITAPENSVVYVSIVPPTGPIDRFSFPDFDGSHGEGATRSDSQVAANLTIYYVKTSNSASDRYYPVSKGSKVERLPVSAVADNDLTVNHRPSAHIPGENARSSTGTSASPDRPKDRRRIYSGDFYEKAEFTIGTSDNLRCPTQGHLVKKKGPNGVGSFELETKDGRTRLLAFEDLEGGGRRLMDDRCNTFITSGPDHVRFASLKTPVWPGPQPSSPDPMRYYPEDAMFSVPIPKAEVQDFLNDRKESEDEFKEELRVKDEKDAARMEIWAERCKEERAQRATCQASERGSPT